jgi:hypothetical protein
MQGDNFIHWWATSRVLLKLCEQADPPIQMTEDALPMRTGVDGGLNLYKRALEVVNSDNALAVSKNVTFSRQKMETMANALGVTMTAEELDSIPQPLKTDATALSKFDRERVLQRSIELDELNNTTTITIVQAGSSPYKRFSNQQIEELIDKTRQTFGADCKITVVTDRQAANPRFETTNRNEREIVDFSADTTVEASDINEISAHFAKKTDLIITTDTFYSHLAAGCQEMARQHVSNFSPAQILVLYTLAEPTLWGINGTTPIVSELLQELLKDESNMYPGAEGLVAPDAYGQLSLDDQKRRGGFDERFEAGISPVDIDAIKEQLNDLILKDLKPK